MIIVHLPLRGDKGCAFSASFCGVFLETGELRLTFFQIRSNFDNTVLCAY